MARKPEAPPPKPKRKAPGIPLHLAFVVAFGVLLASYSSPVSSTILWVGGLVVLAVLLLFWLRSTFRFVMAWRGGGSSGPKTRVLVVPLLAAVVAGLVTVDVPLEARWRLSRADFADAVRGPELISTAEVDRIGLYGIEEIFRHADATYFQTDSGLFARGGFVHLPSGPSVVAEVEAVADFGYRPIDGEWWVWIDES